MINYTKIFFCFTMFFFISISVLKAEIFTVTNTNSSGVGSLMQAVTDADNTAGADTIIFAANVRGTINNNGTITPSESLIIIGPGPDLLAVTSGGTGRVSHHDRL